MTKKIGSQKQAIAFDKTLFLLLTKSTNARKFLENSFFRSVFFGLLRPLLQICRIRLTQTPQKILTNSP